MSFYKFYPKRKDRRKQYRDSRAFDSSCKNHGSCPWCRSNRLYQYRKSILIARSKIKEYQNGEY